MLNRDTSAARISALLLALAVAGCSSLPDELDPVEWVSAAGDLFSGDDEPNSELEARAEAERAGGIPGEDDPYPTLGQVPDQRPDVTPVAERESIASQLVADRANAQYSDETIAIVSDGNPQWQAASRPVAAPPPPPVAPEIAVAAPQAEPAPEPAPAPVAVAQPQPEPAPEPAAVAAPALISTSAPDPVVVAEAPPPGPPPVAAVDVPPPPPVAAPAVPNRVSLIDDLAAAARDIEGRPPPSALPPPPMAAVPQGSGAMVETPAVVASPPTRLAAADPALPVPQPPPVRAPSPVVGNNSFPVTPTVPTPPDWSTADPIYQEMFSASGRPPATGDVAALGAAAGLGLPGTGGSLHAAVIYFGHGSSNLVRQDNEVLRQVAAAYQDHGGRVRVVGHASSRTKTSQVAEHVLANYTIAVDRAQAVASALMRLGVPAGAVEVSSVADSDPAYSEATPMGEAANRRADIYLDLGY